VRQFFTGTDEVELANPLRNCRVHQDISCRVGDVTPPRQEEGSAFRTRVEQGPRFDGTCDPVTPKSRETNRHIVPTPADLEKGKSSGSETSAVVLQARFDDVEKHLRQKLRWETRDSGVWILDMSWAVGLPNVFDRVFAWSIGGATWPDA